MEKQQLEERVWKCPSCGGNARVADVNVCTEESDDVESCFAVDIECVTCEDVIAITVHVAAK